MCGIAGLVRCDGAPINPDRVGRMLAHLRHRGPDGEGTWHGDSCALVHTRLSIIDLLSGAQPMHIPTHGECGPLHLVFNGEIYNHRPLRKQLERLGHQFTSDHSDTEVILFGYREWGDELPKHLHGMFAFAIWNESTRQLFLCRDRAGKKPLFIRWSDDKRELAFASLVATLIQGGQSKPTIDPLGMLHFLRLGYTDQHTMFAGIEEIPAAHWMRLEHDGRVTLKRYWQPPPISKTSTAMGAASATQELLEEAIAVRLESDVPLGCFLSGGIDSSVIAAIAHRQLQERGAGPLHTFSITMPEIGYDESVYARQVAEHLGTVHRELSTEIRNDGTSVIDDMIALTAVSGQPTADSSALPTYWISRATREHVKVALSGDGGDELFGGYDRYRAMRLLDRFGGIVAMAPSRLARSNDPKSRSNKWKRLVQAARTHGQAERYASMIELFSDDAIDELGMMPTMSQGMTLPARLSDWEPQPHAVDAAMRWDLTHYLPFDLLRKVDRASMAVGLEVRCPMLDTQLCDLAGHLPAHVLMPRGRSKGLLRQIGADLLPSSIVNRRKQGFAIPIGQWFVKNLRTALGDCLFSGDLDTLGLQREPIQRMYDEHTSHRVDHTHRLFALMSLSIWQRWLQQQT